MKFSNVVIQVGQGFNGKYFGKIKFELEGSDGCEVTGVRWQNYASARCNINFLAEQLGIEERIK